MIFFLLESYGKVMNIDALSIAVTLELETLICHSHKQILKQF